LPEALAKNFLVGKAFGDHKKAGQYFWEIKSPNHSMIVFRRFFAEFLPGMGHLSNYFIDTYSNRKF
jgi:hypothetical protein